MSAPGKPPRLFNRVLAIGVGLIGGSICLGAKQRGLVGHVLGYSRRLETTHEALRLGLIDECVVSPGDSTVRQVDAVVLSIPVRQYKQVLTQFLPVLPANCVIFDAGSTKADVVDMIAELEPQFPGLIARFVPAHPIAGGETHGPAAALPDLFVGKNCVLTPLAGTSAVNLERVAAFWKALGATVNQMQALDHDEMFGTVSHLPHLLAFAAVNALTAQPQGAAYLDMAGPGFRDFSRIAASDASVWRDILNANHAEVLTQVGHFRAALDQFETALKLGDSQTLQHLIQQASDVRSAWTLQAGNACNKASEDK